MEVKCEEIEEIGINMKYEFHQLTGQRFGKEFLKSPFKLSSVIKYFFFNTKEFSSFFFCKLLSPVLTLLFACGELQIDMCTDVFQR